MGPATTPLLELFSPPDTSLPFLSSSGNSNSSSTFLLRPSIPEVFLGSGPSLVTVGNSQFAPRVRPPLEEDCFSSLLLAKHPHPFAFVHGRPSLCLPQALPLPSGWPPQLPA